MITITRRQALKGMAGMGVALVATACGGGAPAAAPTEAPKAGATEAPAPAPAAEKVTLRWDVSDATDVPTMLKMAEQGAALFAQKFPNIEVKPEPPPENQQQQILTEMVAGNAPDIIGYCCDYLPFWAGKGQLLKLDPYVEKDITPEQIKDYPPAHWNAFSNPRVGRYALPMYMGTIVLYYNKDMFDAAGVAYPDDTWDWNLQGTGKYEEALKKLSNPDKKVWGARIGDGTDRIQQKLAGNGGHWVDPNDDMKAAFDQEPAVGALQWLYDRIWKDNTVIRDTAREGQNWETLMGNGRIAMYENGDWQLDPMVKTAEGKYKWDVAPLPKGPVARNSLATTDGWAIWKGSKHPNEGWEFLKFLQSDEWNNLLITVALLRPSRLSLFDKWLTLVPKAVPGLADKNLKAFGDAVAYATPLELFQFNAEATEIINASIRDAVIRTNSTSDVVAACKDAASKVNDAEVKAKAAAS
jgi:multiple sugar transport system substrate-binding protein